MPQKRVQLASVFQTVTQSLEQNQLALNQADDYNKNHGSNMVQTFQTITNALQEKKGKSDSTALAHAAKKLAQNTTSSSGQLYAQGLAQAAAQFKGKKVDERGALSLLQTLIGGGQAQPQPATQPANTDMLGALLGGLGGGEQAPSQPAGGDMLGSLLGGLTGGEQPQSTEQPAGGDMLGALLGGLTGGEQPQSTEQPAGGDMLGALLGGLTGGGNSGAGLSDGLDLGDLLNAGMAYFQAKQSGGSTAQALVQAFVSASGMGKSIHRTQSTSIVVDSFLQALKPASSSDR